jgi:hypothetical protein
MSMTTKIVSNVRRKIVAGLAAGLALFAGTEAANAQEILLTGPLAGAPAVRKLKLYRQNRFEIAPAVSFTLLDEYQRQIFVGARVNYNLTDWLAIGFWGAASPGPLKITTGLADDIQKVNAQRRAQDLRDANNPNVQHPSKNQLLTQNNLGPDFTKQLGTMDWVFAPQVTFVPFRGKIALFQSIFADTDLYVFGGPAFIGVQERGDCGAGKIACSDPNSFKLASRVAIAPTFGLGFSFYVNKWNAFGFEWRGMPFSRNTGGFDNHGRDPDNKFPDFAVNDKDREFKFNQMITVSWGFYFPTQYKVSE